MSVLVGQEPSRDHGRAGAAEREHEGAPQPKRHGGEPHGERHHGREHSRARIRQHDDADQDRARRDAERPERQRAAAPGADPQAGSETQRGAQPGGVPVAERRLQPPERVGRVEPGERLHQQRVCAERSGQRREPAEHRRPAPGTDPREPGRPGESGEVCQRLVGGQPGLVGADRPRDRERCERRQRREQRDRGDSRGPAAGAEEDHADADRGADRGQRDFTPRRSEIRARGAGEREYGQQPGEAQSEDGVDARCSPPGPVRPRRRRSRRRWLRRRYDRRHGAELIARTCGRRPAAA